MLNDIATSIKAQLFDRLTNPLTGAFLIAWPVWNWRFLTVVLSKLDPATKIAYVELHIYKDFASTALTGVVYPLATACIATTIYPYVGNFFYKISLFHKKRSKSIQQQIEDTTPMLIEEAAKLRRDLLDIQIGNDSKFEKKLAELQTVSTDYAKAEERIIELQSSRDVERESLQSELNKLKQLAESQTDMLANRSRETMRMSELLTMTAPTLRHQGDNSFAHFQRNNLENYASETQAVGIEKSIEESLNNFIRGKDILADLTPRIHAINGKIYLNLNTDNCRTVIVSEYSEKNLDSAIASSKMLIEDYIPSRI